jgi:hypothetical protein
MRILHVVRGAEGVGKGTAGPWTREPHRPASDGGCWPAPPRSPPGHGRDMRARRGRQDLETEQSHFKTEIIIHKTKHNQRPADGKPDCFAILLLYLIILFFNIYDYFIT